MIHLLWLSLAVPLIIHLVHRRKARRVPFSTLRFLQMVDQRVARRQKLKELLLLAARLLLLIAVVAALYRPAVRSPAFTSGRVPASVVLLLDDTASMRATTGGVPRFHSARLAALEVLDGLESGDSVALVRFSEPEPVEFTTDLPALRSRIEGAVCGFGSAGAAPALQTALTALDEAQQTHQELYVISDFQRHAWQPLAEAALTEPPGLALFLVDVGGPLAHNLALPNVRFNAPVRSPGADATLVCTLRNTGTEAAHTELTLDAGAVKTTSEGISLEAGGETMVALPCRPSDTGPFTGRAQLGPDSLMADNARFFAVDVRERVLVLLVDGDTSAVPYLSETFFVNLALRAPAGTGPDATGPSALVTRTASTDELATHRLTDYACIMLCDVEHLPAEGASAVRAYVEAGGGLVIFVGDRFSAAQWNGALGPAGANLLPAPLGRPVEANAGALRVLDHGHPVVTGLSDYIEGPSVRVSRYYSVGELLPDVSTILAVQGSPLLMERKVGAGSVMLWATSAAMDWSNLPARSFFLPMLHQTVYYLGNLEGDAAGLQVGMPIVLEMPPGEAAYELVVSGPGSEGARTIRIDVPAGGGKISFAETNAPGLYRTVWNAAGVPHERAFAVNVAPEESLPGRFSPEDVPALLPSTDSYIVSDARQVTAAVRRMREGLPLWNWLFAAAMLVAVVETWIANVLLRH